MAKHRSLPLPRLALFAALALTLTLTLGLAPTRAEGEPVTIMAFGDSLTHGYGLPSEDAYPAQLEALLRAEGYDAEVVNAGNSGETTAGGLARLEWSLADDPDIVILALGANDGLRGLDPADTRANLDAMLEILKERGIEVLLAGMLAPRNLGADYAEAFDSLYPALAAKHAVAFYPFLLKDVAAEPDLNQPDGIHPNAEGAGVIAENLLPHVADLIEKQATASN